MDTTDKIRDSEQAQLDSDTFLSRKVENRVQKRIGGPRLGYNLKLDIYSCAVLNDLAF